MANDACIGLKKIHKDSIYDYDKSKNNTFIFMVNKLLCVIFSMIYVERNSEITRIIISIIRIIHLGRYLTSERLTTLSPPNIFS
jgi:hypothetical protein